MVSFAQMRFNNDFLKKNNFLSDSRVTKTRPLLKISVKGLLGIFLYAPLQLLNRVLLTSMLKGCRSEGLAGSSSG